jgi:hypothetical protein
VLPTKIKLLNSSLIYSLHLHKPVSDSSIPRSKLNKDDLLTLIQYSQDRNLVEKVIYLVQEHPSFKDLSKDIDLAVTARVSHGLHLEFLMMRES